MDRGNSLYSASGFTSAELDEHGLAEAIRDHVWHSGSDAGDLRLQVSEVPTEFSPLPAAVEVAAYRIALEALTNIIRHAHAKHCVIQFTKHGEGYIKSLQMEIVDNGIGLPSELHAGIGLHSMRERAEDLGGMLTVEPVSHGGTRVLAILPLVTTPN